MWCVWKLCSRYYEQTTTTPPPTTDETHTNFRLHNVIYASAMVSCNVSSKFKRYIKPDIRASGDWITKMCSNRFVWFTATSPFCHVSAVDHRLSRIIMQPIHSIRWWINQVFDESISLLWHVLNNFIQLLDAGVDATCKFFDVAFASDACCDTKFEFIGCHSPPTRSLAKAKNENKNHRKATTALGGCYYVAKMKPICIGFGYYYYYYLWSYIMHMR